MANSYKYKYLGSWSYKYILSNDADNRYILSPGRFSCLEIEILMLHVACLMMSSF